MVITKKAKFLLLFLSAFLYSQSEMPIMAFHSFTPETSTLSNFIKFKEAGFNINHTIFKTNDQVQAALDLAQKAGIKMIIYSDELVAQPEKTITRFRKHPALYGYFLADEPSPKDFARLNTLINKMNSLDPAHPIYINLHPNYAPPSYLGNKDYKDYVDQYLRSVSVKFLSFDNYPIVNNKIMVNWYQNLEIIRDNSIKYNKPFWAFANATIFNNYKQPTAASLKLQQYSNLLYGAKGIQYFTYITMDDEYWKLHKFSYAIVYNSGKPTPTYNLVKNLNKQIKTLSWIFTKSKVDSVFHIGDTIPLGTKRMNFSPKNFKIFKNYRRNALVSFMSAGNRKFVIIQNKDIFKPMTLNYQILPGVSKVNNSTGKIVPVSTKESIATIPPGDILIFTYL